MSINRIQEFSSQVRQNLPQSQENTPLSSALQQLEDLGKQLEAAATSDQRIGISCKLKGAVKQINHQLESDAQPTQEISQLATHLTSSIDRDITDYILSLTPEKLEEKQKDNDFLEIVRSSDTTKLWNSSNLRWIMFQTVDEQSIRLFTILFNHHLETTTPQVTVFTSIDLTLGTVLSRDFSEPYDTKFLESLCQSPLFPSYMLQSDPKVLTNLKNHPKISASIKAQLASFGDDATLNQIGRINSLSKELKINYSNMSQEEIKAKFNEIDSTLQLLHEKNYPYYDILKNDLSKSTQDVRQLLSLLELENPKTEDFTKVPSIVKDQYEKFLIQQKDWGKLNRFYNLTKSHHYTDRSERDKLAFHLLLDKTFTPNLQRCEGFTPTVTAHALMRAIATIDTTGMSPQIAESVTTLQERMPPLLTNIAYFYGNRTARKKEVAQEVVQKITTMKVGDQLLLPTGMDDHATCLLVTKTKENTFQLAQYNTGGGIFDWHDQWKNTNRFQTFYIIDDVPMSSLVNQSDWEKLFYNLTEEKSMDPTYTLLKDTLGKGGRVLPPSKDPEWYEAKQSAGTCAMQSLMAFSRHQILVNGQGTIEERKALYKIVKAHLFESFTSSNISQTDGAIQTQSRSAIEKFQADLQFSKIATNPVLYKATITKIYDAIEKMGHKELVVELKKREPKSDLERYATLRSASDLLCSIWMSEQADIPETLRSDDAFGLALARFEHKKAARNNLKLLLEGLKQNPDQFLRKCVSLIVSYKHSDIALEQIVLFIGEENPNVAEPERTKKMLEQFQRFSPSKRKPHIDAIIASLEKKGKGDLAQWIKSQPTYSTSA